MKKITIQKRAEIAKSLCQLVLNNTETFSDTGIISYDGKEYNGEHAIGVDLAYLMGAILEDEFFDAVSEINALPYWLKEEHPEHEALQFIQFED